MIQRMELLRMENMKQCGFGVDEMKKIKVCTACGNPSPNNEQFCRECGYRLPDKTLYDIYKERHKTCPSCETVVADNSEYCPQCGNKLDEKKTNITHI